MGPITQGFTFQRRKHTSSSVCVRVKFFCRKFLYVFTTEVLIRHHRLLCFHQHEATTQIFPGTDLTLR